MSHELALYLSEAISPTVFYFFWLYQVLVSACGTSSLTTDRTKVPYVGSVESQLKDHQGSPSAGLLNIVSQRKTPDMPGQ